MALTQIERLIKQAEEKRIAILTKKLEETEDIKELGEIVKQLKYIDSQKKAEKKKSKVAEEVTPEPEEVETIDASQFQNAKSFHDLIIKGAKNEQ